MALVQLGAAVISNIDEPSTNATYCRTMWDICRNSLMREHAWNFATKRAILLQSVTPPIYRYKYAYQLPPNLLRVLTVYSDDRVNDDFKIEGTKLLTDQNNIQIKYIEDITTVAEWDPSFQEVMAAKLRAAIAYSITRSTSQTELSENLFLTKFQRAMQVDATEDIEDLIGQNDVDFLTVRYE